jgi:hypothetical protein
MAKARFSADEIIASMSTTGIPTVFVEGPSEIIVWRWLESLYGSTNLNLQNCEGRANVLAVFERRAELPSNIPFAFLADSDLWIFTGKPPIYSDVICTHGYCIENDVLEPLDDLLTQDERTEVLRLVHLILPWYVSAVETIIPGTRTELNRPINALAPHPSRTLAPYFQAQVKTTINPALLARVQSDHKTLLHGKILSSIFCRVMGQSSVSYNENQLLDLAIRTRITDKMRSVAALTVAALGLDPSILPA